jgi:hypothetical protein
VRAAIVSEETARELFGSPEQAVGQTVRTDDDVLHVVGVMSSRFAFPDQRVGVWRALDLDHADGVNVIGRLLDGVGLERLTSFFTTLPADTVASLSLDSGFRLRAVPLESATVADETRRLMLLLLGTGVCLLLAACANVIGLEISTSLTRVPAQAIQLALGTSRASLVRIAGIEGGVLIATSTLVTVVLSGWAMDSLRVWIPDLVARATANRIDIDARSNWFLCAAALLVWLAAGGPPPGFAATCSSDPRAPHRPEAGAVRGRS